MRNLREEAKEAIADFLDASDGQDLEWQAVGIVDMLADMGIGLADLTGT